MPCMFFVDRRAARVLAAVAVLAGAAPAGAQAPEGAGARRYTEIVSSEFGLSRDAAELRLELAGGRTVELEIRGDEVRIDGERVGRAPRGQALERSWRELLAEAMDAPAERLAPLLVDWDAPDGEAGGRLDAALEAALAGGGGGAAPAAGSASAEADAEGRWASDTVARLHERIAELEARLSEARESERSASFDRYGREDWWGRPFRRIYRGIADIISMLAIYAVVVGIGFAVVYFGRKYLEGVADTARHATVQSGLVGLAATFLVVPAFILGAIALVVSIVGIPVLLAWIPLFPLAVVVAAIFGYLGVAHAAGESLAERRFNGGELFRRANSYYYVLTGVGLLLALYIAAGVVEMAGPWLGFIRGLLLFFAIVVTWAAFTIGFGAVLLSRAGTRPKVERAPEPDVDVGAAFEERSHV